MFLAEKTVKNYVSSILSKLGLERRTQAAVLASKLLGGETSQAPMGSAASGRAAVEVPGKDHRPALDGVHPDA